MGSQFRAYPASRKPILPVGGKQERVNTHGLSASLSDVFFAWLLGRESDYSNRFLRCLPLQSRPVLFVGRHQFGEAVHELKCDFAIIKTASNRIMVGCFDKTPRHLESAFVGPGSARYGAHQA